MLSLRDYLSSSISSKRQQMLRVIASGAAVGSSAAALVYFLHSTINNSSHNRNERTTHLEASSSSTDQHHHHHQQQRQQLHRRPTFHRPVVQLKDIPTREEQLQRLKQSASPQHSAVFDVLVIGGGATGAGTALDAQLRGLSTAMIERNDFGGETSARSTKLIWAGIKYLAVAFARLLDFHNIITQPVATYQEFASEFHMVMGCQRERRILLENNPHLTNWVPIAVPVKHWIAWPPPFGHSLFAAAPLVFPLVFKFYDSLSGFSCPPSHIMGKSRSRRKFPQLIDEDLKYAQIFYEGQHNDARTATYIALTAAEEGACIANHVEMVGLLKDPTTGKAVGVICRDNLTHQEFPVHAKAIIFAGGPFTDELRQIEDPQAKPAVAGARGTHIVLPGYYSPSNIGMLDMNTSDGRFLFFLPWHGATLVGTTDSKDTPVSTPEPPEQEIQWILKEVEKYLSPELKVRRADVLSAWQGFRPLAAADPNMNTDNNDATTAPGTHVSRDHVISTNPVTGVTFITGGKWTTYREMAEDVVDRVIEQHGLTHAGPCQTKTKKLRGGEGYTKNVPIMLVQEFGVSEDTAKHLASTYGMYAFDVCRGTEPTGKRWPRFGQILIEGFPYLECEVEYACKKEMVCTLTDMLTLRFRLAYLNKDAALTVAPKVADLMQKALGWGRREKNRQLEEAKKYLSAFGGPVPNKLDESSALVTLADVGNLFRTFDQTENGSIDLTDFKDATTILGLPFENDKAALAAFKKLDKDGDGRVTEDEFMEWWVKHDPRDEFRRKLGKQISDKLQ